MSLSPTDITVATTLIEGATDGQLAKATPPEPPPAGGNPIVVDQNIVHDVALAYGNNWPSITSPLYGASVAGNIQSWRKCYQPASAPTKMLADDQVQLIVGLIDRENALRALPPAATISGTKDALVVQGEMTRTGGHPFNVSTIDWDWGDGSHTTGVTSTSHTYAQEGSYTVTVTWADTAAATGSVVKTISVGSSGGVLEALNAQALGEGKVIK